MSRLASLALTLLIGLTAFPAFNEAADSSEVAAPDEDTVALLDQLRSDSSEERANAADRLASGHPPEAIPALRELLTDERRELRLAAARALGGYTSDVEVIAVLAEHARGNPEAERAVVKAGASAIPVLRKLLKSGSPNQRKSAARMLGEIGDKSAVPMLREALDDADLSVRFSVACALAALGSPVEVAPSVSELIEVPLVSLPTWPLDTMGTRMAPPSEEQAEAARRDYEAFEDAKRRIVQGKEDQTEELILALSSQDEEIAKRAAVFLGELKAEEAMEPLCEVLKRKGMSEAAMALGMIGKEAAVPHLLEALETGLSSLIPAEIPEGHIWLMEEDEAHTLEYCAWALAEIGDASVVPHLLALVEDTEYVDLLARNHFPNWAIGEVLSRVLMEVARFRDPRCIPVLFRQVTEGGVTRACDMIADIGGKEADAALFSILKHHQLLDDEALEAAGEAMFKTQCGEEARRGYIESYYCRLPATVWAEWLARKYGPSYERVLHLDEYAPEDPALAEALFIYGKEGPRMGSFFKSLLRDNDIRLRILPQSRLEDEAVTVPLLTIIGGHTSWTGERWERVVSRVNESSSYVVGFGEGGQDFFGCLGQYLGEHGWEGQEEGVLFAPDGHPIQTAPFPLPDVLWVHHDEREIYASNESSQGIGIKLPLEAGLTLIAAQVEREPFAFAADGQSWEPDNKTVEAYILEEDSRYLFCGVFDCSFAELPSSMAEEGRQLFVNVVNYALEQAHKRLSTMSRSVDVVAVPDTPASEASTEGDLVEASGDVGHILLDIAIEAQNPQMLTVLLASGIDTNSRNSDGRTALHKAADVWSESGVELVDTLVANGADVNVQDADGNTPLHLAREPRVAELLLTQGADPNVENHAGLTPLTNALTQSRHVEIGLTDNLILHGANVSLLDAARLGDWAKVDDLLGSQTTTTEPAVAAELLPIAARQGNWSKVDEFLEGHPSLLQGSTGTDLLAIAVSQESAQVTESLLSRGVPPKALTVALKSPEMLSLLLEHNADPNGELFRGGRTLLHMAVRGEAPSVVKLLLEHGADPNAADEEGRTALHEAAEYGTAGVIELLLAHGADLERTDSGGNTPIYWARRFNRVDAMKALMKDDDSTNHLVQENTPLHLAARSADKAEVRRLLAQGADAKARKPRGKTPVDFAVRYIDPGWKGGPYARDYYESSGHVLFPEVHPVRLEILKSLLEAGGECTIHQAVLAGDIERTKAIIQKDPNTVNAKDSHSFTSLHVAVWNRHSELVSQLLESGAVVDAPAEYGIRPIDMARERPDAKVMALLLEHVDKWCVLDAVVAGDLPRLERFFTDKSVADRNLSSQGNPVGFAAAAGHTDIVRVLLENGPGILGGDFMPLMKAAENGHLDVVKLLIAKQVEPFAAEHTEMDYIEFAGNEVLACASKGGRKEVAEFALSRGTNVEAPDHKGKTPLYLAARGGHLELAQFLQEQGARVTTVHEAALLGDLEKVREFVKKDPETISKRCDLLTPLQCAVRSRNVKIAAFLLDRGADANCQPAAQVRAGLGRLEEASYRPLHLAVLNGHEEMVSLLLSHGADVELPSLSGDTPLDLATDLGHEEIVTMLTRFRDDRAGKSEQ